MRSIVFICIPLVVMVTSDVTAADKLRKLQSSVDQSAKNDTDVANVTDASSGNDDGDIVRQVDDGQQPSDEAEEEIVQCSIISEQYDNLNEKLMELAVQLDLLQTAVDGISGNATQKETSECPPEFTESFDGCYRVVNSNLTWSLAALRCQALHPDAHLVVIDNDDEQLTVADIISAHLDNGTMNGCWQDTDGGMGIWTAGQRIDPQSCFSPFVWKTSPCSTAEMGYSKWCPGQPDYWRGQESCANMFVYNESSTVETCLNDIYCETEMCFVCEIDR